PWWPRSWWRRAGPGSSWPPGAPATTGSATICGAARPTTPSRGVWVDDPGGRAGGGRRPVRRRALRGPVPAGGGDGDAGRGVDDQRGAPGRRGVLVVPGPGPLRAGAAAGGAGGHDRGDGHGLCRGDAVAPQAADRHDRHGRGSLRMTADQTLLLTLVVLPAAVGA